MLSRTVYMLGYQQGVYVLCNWNGKGCFMINGIYICDHPIEDESSGVSKKIRMQIDALNQLGLNVKTYPLYDDSDLDKITRRIPFLKSQFNRNLDRLIEEESQKNDFVYIRHPGCNIHLIRTLKKMSSRGKLIVYEFPTFPYDQNSSNLRWKLLMLKDRFSRNKLKKYVDIGVNFSEYDEIFGIKCIKICNGINPEKISPRKVKKDGKIRFLAVAFLAYWNGYDRLIQAIYEYYQQTDIKYDIEFDIAGDGDALPCLKKLVTDLELENRVFFHGYVSGIELSELYNQCDIAVGTLAHFRKYKNHVMSTLKTKEYTAKGIPFIKSDPDVIFDDYHLDFVYNVSCDEALFDLENIVEWYLNLQQEYPGNDLVQHIRQYAFDKLSWNRQLQPVVKYILENVKAI